MTYAVTVKDQSLTLNVDPKTRHVVSIKDADGSPDGWLFADQLEALGFLRSEFYGPETYGHTSFFWVAS